MSSPTYLRPSQEERDFDAVRAMLRTSEKPIERKATDWRTSIFLVLAIIVLAVPALMMLWPKPALIAADNRSVVITGPITSFEQSATQLRLRLAAEAEGQSLIITSASPDTAEIVTPVKAGWIEVKLPPSLVAASSLDVSVR